VVVLCQMQAKEQLEKMVEDAKADVEKLGFELRSAKARLKAFQESGSVVEAAGADGAAQTVFRRLGDKVRKEQTAIAEIETKVVDATARVSALEEALKLFPKEGETSDLRAGTQMAEVQAVLRAHGKAMSLAEILKAIGAAGDEGKRNSLRGSLASYARDGRVFTKEDGSDTFGLIEFGTEASVKGQ